MFSRSDTPSGYFCILLSLPPLPVCCPCPIQLPFDKTHFFGTFFLWFFLNGNIFGNICPGPTFRNLAVHKYCIIFLGIQFFFATKVFCNVYRNVCNFFQNCVQFLPEKFVCIYFFIFSECLGHFFWGVFFKYRKIRIWKRFISCRQTKERRRGLLWDTQQSIQ